MAQNTFQLISYLLLFGFGGNFLNIGVNTQAVGVESMYKKPIMGMFHGMWSLAGFSGAAIGTLMIGAGIVPVQHFLAVTIFVVLAALISTRFTIAEDPNRQADQPIFAKPDKSLLMLGIIAFCSMICEGAMFDWSGVYFKKVVMADTMLAGAADSVFTFPHLLLSLDAWMGVLAFSGQIFFDFAGYSTCAIGVAMCLGFKLPENFRYPYAAIGFSDFWRRWHITLSTWLRDYLYIPVGGNRHGGKRTYINLMLTMVLGGLWHGASWTFVVWGALHGIYLCVERMLRSKKTPIDDSPLEIRPTIITSQKKPVVMSASFAPAFLRRRSVHLFFAALFTFFLVNVTWVFFRAADFDTAWRILASMFGFVKNGAALLSTLDIIKVSVITVLLISTHWLMRNTSILQVTQKAKWWLTGLAWAAMLILLVLSQKSSDSFIYFQF